MRLNVTIAKKLFQLGNQMWTGLIQQIFIVIWINGRHIPSPAIVRKMSWLLHRKIAIVDHSFKIVTNGCCEGKINEV